MSGLVTEDEFEVNQPIGQFEYKHCRLTGFLWAAVDGGKPSHSIFKVLRRDTEKNETLCEVTITTGTDPATQHQ
jgi:23S rRNA-/tRNA-specific pseudouridylate synthase